MAADAAGLRYEVCGGGGGGEASEVSAASAADLGGASGGASAPGNHDDEADGSVRLRCPARGVLLRPEEVSAELLRHLLARARAHFGCAVTNAVSLNSSAVLMCNMYLHIRIHLNCRHRQQPAAARGGVGGAAAALAGPRAGAPRQCRRQRGEHQPPPRQVPAMPCPAGIASDGSEDAIRCSISVPHG